MTPEARDKRNGLGVRAVRGFAWNFGAVAAGKLSFFVATLVLARELDPTDFGVIAFTLAVLAYVETITSHGIGETLVYRADARDPVVASTAFWLSLGSSLVLLGGLWLAAPSIALLGPDDSSLALVVQILSLQLVLSALGSTHGYLLRHSLRFDRLFVPQLLSGLAKGLTAVALAVAGFGVWSLVIGQLAGTIVRSIGLWFTSGWRPRLAFARDKARSLASTGSGFAAIAVIGGAARNADYLIIGISLGGAALGYYYLAFRLPELLILGPFESAWQVLFSYYARLHDAQSNEDAALESLGRGFRESVRLGSLIALPLCAATAALASPIVLTLYGDAWQPAVVPFALIALWAGAGAVSGMAGVVLKSLGRAGTLTTATTISTLVRLPLLWLATLGGITAVAAMQLLAQAVWLVAIFVVAGSVFRISIRAVFAPLAPALLVAVAVGATALGVAQLLPPLPGLLVGILAALAVYAIMLELVCADALRLGMETLRAATRVRRRALSW
jgi:O-antigen/teichoic acid export membrane protein